MTDELEGKKVEETQEDIASRQEPSPQEQTEKPLTHEEAKRLFEEAVDTAVSRAQRHTDKVNQRTLDKIEEVERLTGKPVDDKTKARIRQDILDAEPEDKVSEQATQEPGQEELPPVVQKAIAMMDKYGISLDLDRDPEAKAVITDQGDETYLESFEAQLKAKAQRIASEGKEETKTDRTPTGAGASGGPSIDTFGDKTIDETWEEMSKSL